jgi:hypothetical protein
VQFSDVPAFVSIVAVRCVSSLRVAAITAFVSVCGGGGGRGQPVGALAHGQTLGLAEPTLSGQGLLSLASLHAGPRILQTQEWYPGGWHSPLREWLV